MSSLKNLGNSPVAIIIPNYKMDIWVSSLCSHINTFNKESNYQFIVVNNGSHTKFFNIDLMLPHPLEMTNAILMGLHYADALEQVYKFKFFAYWIITTSMAFLEERDYLTPMLEYMRVNPDVVMCSPSIEGTAWDSLPNQGKGEIRDVWGFDNNAVLIRADWFNSIGRYDPELVIGWGSALETCYIARKQGKRMCVFDSFPMVKHDGIAEKLGKRDMSREERNRLGSEEMSKILGKKYGDNFLEVLGHAYRNR